MVTTEEPAVRLRLFGIPKLIPYLRPYRGRIIGMILLGLISSLIDAVFPLFGRYALDRFVAPGTLRGLSRFIAAFAALLLFQVWDNYVTTYWCGQVEMGVDRDLRNASFSHLQTLSFSYFSRNSVGYIHARVMSDTGKIGELVAWRMMDIVWNGSYLICMFVLMLLLDVRLAGWILLLLPAAVLIIVLFQRRLVRLNRKIREINSKITGDFNEGITGARSIKSLGVERTIGCDFRSDTAEMRSTGIRSGHYAALLTSLVTMFSMFALAIVLWRGGILTRRHLLAVGTLSVFMSYAVGMMEPIQNIIGTLSVLIQIQVNIERFSRLMETKSDVADAPEVVAKYGDSFCPKRENWEELRGDVDFDDVSFTYPDGGGEVLSHFSLHVPKGTNVAIVGETGAGKSTLVNLVCRFYEPTSGRILIDGRDAKERSQLWLHSNIGYVLQTPHLFSGTVRENLRYGRPDATDHEIWEALRLVAADGVVMRMPGALDAEVGESGDMLSTGEKQLLSFARAILADPKILVLDEATASVDTVTEKKIQDAIRAVTAGRTSFVIAHRLSTVVDADVILVVKDGRIIERGTHASLMKKNGVYRKLFTRQYEDLAADMV